MPRKPKPEIKPTRATRRVLLVLLTGASNLSGWPISHLLRNRRGQCLRGPGAPGARRVGHQLLGGAL